MMHAMQTHYEQYSESESSKKRNSISLTLRASKVWLVNREQLG